MTPERAAFHARLLSLPVGAYDATYRDKRYGVRKQTLLEGRLIKLYAEELGGNDFISLNYYPETAGGLLKPCEMPEAKVIAFVTGLILR